MVSCMDCFWNQSLKKKELINILFVEENHIDNVNNVIFIKLISF